jgi:hypothetical protein
MGSETGRNLIQLASHLALKRHGGFTYRDWLRACPRSTIAWVPLPFPVTPSVIAGAAWYRNINLLAIGYAFRPRLRSRLTLSRRTLLRKPRTIGGGDSHPSLVTHAGILTSSRSTARLSPPLHCCWNALLLLAKPAGSQTHSFGDWL